MHEVKDELLSAVEDLDNAGRHLEKALEKLWYSDFSIDFFSLICVFVKKRSMLKNKGTTHRKIIYRILQFHYITNERIYISLSNLII
jgi:hypothetical protein